MKNYEFYELCKEATAEEVKAAINSGADPNARVKYGRTALTAACNCNTSDVVKVLLEAGADPNATEFEGWTALMSVVDKDEVELKTVELLIDAGADVNAKNDFGTTPLLRAVCWNNRPDIVKVLLDAGADMYALGAIGFDDFEYGSTTPVQASIAKWDNTIIKIFLDAGVDVNRRYGGGQTFLIEAAGMYKSADTVRFLLDAGADVNMRRYDDFTALLAAAECYASPDAEDTIKMLLDAGADPNVRYNGLYALDYARRNEALKGTEALRRLEAVTEIPGHSEKGVSVEEFERILEYGSLDRIKEAIEAGADLHAADKPYGETPIIFTLRRRPEPELIKLLLDSGIDVNETGEKDSLYEGVTFLMVALTMPQNTYFKESPYEVIKLLIDYGADVNAKNPNGATALMIAASNRDLEVLKLLIASGAEINAKNNEGYTALMAAAYRGDYESVKFFLSLGVDVSAKDITGRTALIEVMNNLNYISVLDGIKTIRLLISSGAEVNLKALDKGIWTSGNGECYRTPLMMAVNYNKTFYNAMEEICPLPEITEILLNTGAKINEVDSEGNTALMLAVQVNNPDCKVIEMLLDAGADVNVECNGLRAVDYARRNPKLAGTEIFKRLESMTKPLSYKRHVNASEMLELIYKNLADELKAVIADGADVNEREKEGGWTILMSAVRSEEVDLEIIKILLESGAEINATDEFHETALKKAVYNQYNEKSLDLIKLLIDAGADINAVNDEGWTPLMDAAYNCNPDIVKLLIDCGADVNIERKGLRAIDYAYGNELMANTQALKELEVMTASRDNHHKITDDEFVEICEIGSLQQIKKALKAGANADARDSMGATMLMNAVSNHDSPNPELIKLLLNYGADVNARDYSRSVLMQAVYNNALGIDILKLLIDSGADTNGSDEGQSTVLIAASHYNRPEVVKLLIEKGMSDINAQDKFGRTALMNAAWYSNHDVIELLLDLGANVSIKDNEGKCAYDYYAQSAHSYMNSERILKNLQGL